MGWQKDPKSDNYLFGVDSVMVSEHNVMDVYNIMMSVVYRWMVTSPTKL